MADFLKIGILENTENSLETQNKSKEINKFQIVISATRSREIFINCLISCGIGSFKK